MKPPKLPYWPKHPKTKELPTGGFNPLAVSQKPFGLRVKCG